jgi:hypothetical protein
VNNLVQPRHSRRVFERLIAGLTSKKHRREENEDEIGRRKKSFRSVVREKNPPQEEGISKRQISSTFILPLSTEGTQQKSDTKLY